MTNERRVELFAKMFDYVYETAGTGEIAIDIFRGIGFEPNEILECMEQREKNRTEKVDTQSKDYKKFVVFNPACEDALLEGEFGDVLIFDSVVQARMYLEENGATPEQVKRMKYLRRLGTCKRCGGPLFRSLLPGYKYQCFGCDEDFYSIEQ